MSFNPDKFDNVEVLQVGVSGPGNANRLFIACGVAVFNYQGTVGGDWRRDDITFIVPIEGETTPVERGGRALNVGNFVDSVVVAFPATFEAGIGWGVDTVDTITLDGHNVQVTARVVVRTNGIIDRMGFQVNILGQV